MSIYKQESYGVHFYKVENGTCLHVQVNFNSWTINNLPKLPDSKTMIDCSKELFDEKIRVATNELGLKSVILGLAELPTEETKPPLFNGIFNMFRK